MPDNEWAERAAKEITKQKLCDGDCIGVVKLTDIILRYAAPEFAVLEKALEMACDEICSRSPCVFDSKWKDHFMNKAREEVGIGG